VEQEALRYVYITFLPAIKSTRTDRPSRAQLDGVRKGMAVLADSLLRQVHCRQESWDIDPFKSVKFPSDNGVNDMCSVCDGITFENFMKKIKNPDKNFKLKMAYKK
jgi:hypothetical protein